MQKALQWSVPLGFGIGMGTPAEIKNERDKLTSGAEFLQNRGEHLTAQWMRQAAAKASDVYASALRDEAAAAQAREQARADAARRERNDWQQLMGAISYAGQVANNIDQMKATSRAREAARNSQAQAGSTGGGATSSGASGVSGTSTLAMANPSNISQPSANTSNAGQMRSGRAHDISNPANNNDKSAIAGGSTTPTRSKFISKDVTHCVEVVPKGFKCDGYHKRFFKNICGTTKISVWWRIGNEGWSMADLAPNRCYPVTSFRDEGSLQYSACSWDPKASYSPSKDPCRYN